jgi:hypothetical protein
LVAEQTVEGVRNAEDGTKSGLGFPGRVWTLPADAAMREETPREALSGRPEGREVFRDTGSRSQVVEL